MSDRVVYPVIPPGFEWPKEVLSANRVEFEISAQSALGKQLGMSEIDLESGHTTVDLIARFARMHEIIERVLKTKDFTLFVSTDVDGDIAIRLDRPETVEEWQDRIDIAFTEIIEGKLTWEPTPIEVEPVL